MYLCTIKVKEIFDSTNVSRKNFKIMFDNINLQNAVVDFVREITDCNERLVFHLVMAASVSSIPSTTVALCRHIDLITGCGYDYVRRYVSNFNTLYVID